MSDNASTDDAGICSPNRVCFIVAGLLRAAQVKGWTDESLEAASGVKARRIKAWRVEGKEPSLSGALSIAVVLGPEAVNAALALIGYGGAKPLDEGTSSQPSQIVSTVIDGLNVIARAAADNHFDHLETPDVAKAADSIIATLIPVSSAGEAA